MEPSINYAKAFLTHLKMALMKLFKTKLKKLLQDRKNKKVCGDLCLTI